MVGSGVGSIAHDESTDLELASTALDLTSPGSPSEESAMDPTSPASPSEIDALSVSDWDRLLAQFDYNKNSNDSDIAVEVEVEVEVAEGSVPADGNIPEEVASINFEMMGPRPFDALGSVWKLLDM